MQRYAVMCSWNFICCSDLQRCIVSQWYPYHDHISYWWWLNAHRLLWISMKIRTVRQQMFLLETILERMLPNMRRVKTSFRTKSPVWVLATSWSSLPRVSRARYVVRRVRAGWVKHTRTQDTLSVGATPDSWSSVSWPPADFSVIPRHSDRQDISIQSSQG